MASGDRDLGNQYTARWCRALQQRPNQPVVQRARQRVRAALVAVAVLAVGAGTVQVATMHTAPGSGFSTLATVGAEPTGPPGPTGGMTDGGGSQFQPPGLPPSMPDYQGGNNLPPLDQNSGISIYNSGNPQAPQQVPGQQGGQQPQQSWDQPAHGTQMPNYSTAPGYTQGPGKPNPDYQAPQQSSPQQGQQSPQQGQQQQQSPQQSQEQQQNQPEQQQQEQQDQGDQQRQQRCEAMSQQLDQITETAGQVADVVQKVGDAAEVVLPKGGGGSLGPDGERSPGRVPVQPLECGDCPPDRKPQNPFCKLFPNAGVKQTCEGFIDDWMENFKDSCDPGKPNCKGKVPICYPRDVTNPSDAMKKSMQDYIDGGNKLIRDNEKLGGQVIKRSTNGLSGRREADKKLANLRYGEKAFDGKAYGHIPDLTWMGTILDERDVIPFDKDLNSSIGGQSNRFKTDFQATEFVVGYWGSVVGSKNTQCLAPEAVA
ncbi:hypothetical protein D2E33_04220 [Mycobacteroides abscessus]|uniref:hypothetical protein n=1 Tax=Mycobacteroides abscessus TaxID=36809 RepID=UPI000C260547|nr:hypothetical protein [Mycobacteroides abscessus]RIR62894.1 hypothetical protein D2E33_04220 [Mycobacteroides abscessus]